MSTDFEERLRADMRRVQVRPRPGLAREAHRRYARSRRRTALAIAATGTAAAVVGATAGFALSAATPGTGPIETTAYVVNRISGALAATDAIGYTTARYSGTGDIGSLSDRVVVWQFGDLVRQLIESSAGQPLLDSSARPADG